MAFHDVEFPKEVAFGSLGGPKFMTTVQELASGIERRNQEWQDVRAEYDVSHAVKIVEEADALRAFFYARRGRLHSFRFHDHADYIAQNQTLGTGDGTTTTFQLVKVYSDGFTSYSRPITKPKTVTHPDDVSPGVGNVRVNGVIITPSNYSINYSTGVITFDAAPGVGLAVTVDEFQFDVHARFDTDIFDIRHDDVSILSWGQIPIVEVKGE